MNKRTLVIVSIVVGIFLVGGGALAYTSDQNKKKDAENAEMMKNGEVVIVENGEMAKEDDVTMIKGSFTDYDVAKLANAEKGDVVLYFSAPWCPTCQEANKNFNASSTPDGLTLLKVDYDSSTDLKRKYGVTYQHSFVQVDKDGKLLKKWNGSNTYDQLKSEII